MADNRVTLTAKLTPGKDDDLILWWESLPKGDYKTDGRQSIIKSALRYALELPQQQPEFENNTPADFDIDTLRQEIYEQVKLELMSDIEKRLNNPFVPPAPPSVEAADQLDAQTANERKNRLRGANW